MSEQAVKFALEWRRHWYGFWGAEAEVTGRKFVLEDHIYTGWMPSDHPRLVAYLKESPIAVAAQQSPAKCGFCDENLYLSTYRSDGVFLWPDSLAHLVEKHAFMLPNIWVERIRGLDYVVPLELSVSVEHLPWPAT